MKQNADLLNNNKEAKNQIDQLNQNVDQMKLQIEWSRRIIRPLRIRQLIEQFIIKVRNDQGKAFEINNFDMKKYDLQAEDLVYIKEAKKEANTIIHTPNEYEIALAINEAEDDEGLQYSLRRIFLATFNKDPSNY